MKLKNWNILGVTNSITGFASVLGSWQVCHSVCLGIIALLSVLGITLTWMPFAFLTQISIQVWSVAVVLLLITALIHIKKACISTSILLLNSGLIIAGTPFQALQKFIVYFWFIGGFFVLLSVYSYFNNRRCCK